MMPTYNCVQCRKPLTLVLDAISSIYSCDLCQGVWVKRVDEAAFMRAVPKVFSIDELIRLRKLYQPLGKDDPVRLRACPECRELMYRRNWGGHSGVIVDRCEDHGTWFDQGEVGKVHDYIEHGGIEFEKLRLTERGLMELEGKLDRRTAELDIRTIRAYQRARLWSLAGF